MRFISGDGSCEQQKAEQAWEVGIRWMETGWEGRRRLEWRIGQEDEQLSIICNRQVLYHILLCAPPHSRSNPPWEASLSLYGCRNGVLGRQLHRTHSSRQKGKPDQGCSSLVEVGSVPETGATGWVAGKARRRFFRELGKELDAL